MKEFDALFEVLEAIHPLPPTEKDHLRPSLKLRRLEKGDFFLRPDLQATHIAYLVSGLIRYYYVSAEGKEFIKHFCFDGHFVSSTGDYYIEALEPSTLIVFPYAAWMQLMQRHPAWGVVNAYVQAEALVRAEKRERSLILDDARTRYLALLDEVPGIETRVKQYDLANYLGITPVALSRIRSEPARK